MKWAVLVSGRGSNLLALVEAGCPIYRVLSHRPQALALDIAQKAGIAHRFLNPHQFEDRLAYDRALAEDLEVAEIEAVVLAGYLRLITPPLVERYAGRMINVHPSLLPAFPGLHAVKQALDYGVKVTGATVHFVDTGLDSGPIIAQEAVTIRPDDTENTLASRIQSVEHRLLPAAVHAIDQGKIRIEGRKVISEDYQEG